MLPAEPLETPRLALISVNLRIRFLVLGALRSSSAKAIITVRHRARRIYADSLYLRKNTGLLARSSDDVEVIAFGNGSRAFI